MDLGVVGRLRQQPQSERDSRGLPWLDGIVQDVRHAVRTLRHDRGFTFTAIATLAVGIGVNATVFTVTNATLYKGFPGVTENERLVYVTSTPGCCVSYPDFEDWRDQATSFDGMALVHGLGITLSDPSGLAERFTVTEVSERRA